MHVGRWSRAKVVAGCVLGAACLTALRTAPQRSPRVRPGIDVLISDSFQLIRGKRIGLVTNIAAVDANGLGDIQRLRAAGAQLVALFGPEHGLDASAAPGQRVASNRDSTGIPIYSLYGRTTAPTDSMLQGIDMMVVDLPDVGARYYTYLATTIEVMKAAALHRLPVIVLDRPDPVSGAMQGNVLDTAYRSMVGALAVPMRMGLTPGEQARLARSDLRIGVELHVIPVMGWSRGMLLPQTGLPFHAPSPNLQSFGAVLAYSGTCLFEGTALSVGRGTDRAFEQVGAPWLDTAAILTRLRQANLPGVAFEGVGITPHQAGDQKFADTALAGIRLRITDSARFDPPRTAITMLAVIHDVHPGQIRIGGSFDRLAGGPALRTALLRGDRPEKIIASWGPALSAFRRRVRPFLMYR